jgi:hypothetical protein
MMDLNALPRHLNTQLQLLKPLKKLESMQKTKLQSIGYRLPQINQDRTSNFAVSKQVTGLLASVLISLSIEYQDIRIWLEMRGQTV